MLRGLVAAAALCLSAPAWGYLPQSCFTDEGCDLPTGFGSTFDFEVVGDHSTVIFNFRLESADPAAIFDIGGPTNFENRRDTRTANGFVSDFYSYAPFPYVTRTLKGPLWTRLIFRGDVDYFFNCRNPGPIGEICGVEHRAIWNDYNFAIHSSAPTARLRISIQRFAGVPEPKSWALMVVGFALLGGAIRTRPRGNPNSRVYKTPEGLARHSASIEATMLGKGR